MFRFLERTENTARLIEAGFRIALTRSSDFEAQWKSVVVTAGVDQGYRTAYSNYEATTVLDYLLRDTNNPSSVISATEKARTNARMVRTALTTEVWEAVNENWMTMTELLKKPVRQTELPSVLATIRQQSALVHGALHGTMLRNDVYDFARLGTFVERADSTARIIDVKYHTLLPSTSFVGSSMDNVQWEMVLRSVSAHRAFRWLQEEEMTSTAIANFLILDRRLPRSLVFCSGQIAQNLEYLAQNYDHEPPCLTKALALHQDLQDRDINAIFKQGLHGFIQGFIRQVNDISLQVEHDYRFIR